MIVYQVKNLVNDKLYIGITNSNIYYRKWQHLDNAKNGIRTAFYNAIRKYGENNFEFTILDETCQTREELNEKEKYYIQTLDTISPNGYNMTSGGDGNDGSLKPNLGTHLTEEQKQRISRTLTGRKQSEETKLKRTESLKRAYSEGRRVAWNKGLTKDDHPSLMLSSIKKQNQVPWNKGLEGFLKGKVPWNKGLTGIKTNNKGQIAWNKGLTKDTDERLLKLSQNGGGHFQKDHIPWNKGISYSESVRIKMSETRKGIPKSPEAKERMRLGQIKRRNLEKEKLLKVENR